MLVKRSSSCINSSATGFVSKTCCFARNKYSFIIFNAVSELLSITDKNRMLLLTKTSTRFHDKILF